MVNRKILILPSTKNVEEVIRGLPIPIDYTRGKYSELEFLFNDNELRILHNGNDIKDFSSVWLSSYWDVRDLAYSVKLYLEYHNVQHTYVEKSHSKITDQVIFKLKKIALPLTYYVNSKDIEKHLENIESICEYPLIIKDINGSRGKNSVYISNRHELFLKYKVLPKNRRYLFQQYIPNDYDWGIMVADGKVVSAERSYPGPGEFRNNACNGAKEEFVKQSKIPTKIRNMAIEASNALGLVWSRVDIIVDKFTTTPYLMEVNRFPGISSGSSEVTGAQNFLLNHLMPVIED